MADDAENLWTADPRELLRADEEFDLWSMDRDGKPGWDGGKAEGKAFTAARGRLLSELQERLFAHGRSGGDRSVLLIVQGLDTAGKGGVARHVLGMVDPQGVALASFGVPTEEERSHHYLWRIRKKLPAPGYIGVFDRSHYEDVLVVRVKGLVEEDVWSARYDEINEFEREIVASGTVVVKVALMVSHDEQGLRLMERLDRPDKYWKYNPSDVETREAWGEYQQAYADVFERTSTEHAPWHVVPADRKWYSRLAITEILTRTLADLDLGWPEAEWDVAEERRRLARTLSPAALAEARAKRPELAEGVAQSELEFAEAVEEVD